MSVGEEILANQIFLHHQNKSQFYSIYDQLIIIMFKQTDDKLKVVACFLFSHLITTIGLWNSMVTKSRSPSINLANSLIGPNWVE